MLNDGDKAPDFDLPSDQGGAIKLSKLKGKPVVVYFYPKDDTPGCTTEAKDFSCLVDDFRTAGCEIIGISPEGTTSKAKFREKHALTVHLAADEETKTATAYGVWVEKSMYGKKYMGVGDQRSLSTNPAKSPNPGARSKSPATPTRCWRR
jgi:thioredoxin-dependent peroxiredoxin